MNECYFDKFIIKINHQQNHTIIVYAQTEKLDFQIKFRKTPNFKTATLNKVIFPKCGWGKLWGRQDMGM